MIKEYRDGLETFIGEQIQGPGISGFRFLDIEDPILEHDLTSLSPLSYTNEIINIVPAGVYSTGILFPEDKSKASPSSQLTNQYDGNSA